MKESDPQFFTTMEKVMQDANDAMVEFDNPESNSEIFDPLAEIRNNKVRKDIFLKPFVRIAFLRGFESYREKENLMRVVAVDPQVLVDDEAVDSFAKALISAEVVDKNGDRVTRLKASLAGNQIAVAKKFIDNEFATYTPSDKEAEQIYIYSQDLIRTCVDQYPNAVVTPKEVPVVGKIIRFIRQRGRNT